MGIMQERATKYKYFVWCRFCEGTFRGKEVVKPYDKNLECETFEYSAYSDNQVYPILTSIIKERFGYDVVYIEEYSIVSKFMAS